MNALEKKKTQGDCFICKFLIVLFANWKIYLTFAAVFILEVGYTTIKTIKNMDISKFKHQSSARIINRKEVEVTAPDGEVFTVLCQIGSYINEETRKQELFWLESLFDKNFSDNKEQMINDIWRESLRFGIGGGILGISSGTRHEDRARIGNRIKEIREERGIEARDLSRLVGIDAANLSRIENGRYSVGLDILAKIATALGKKVDFVDIDQ